MDKENNEISSERYQNSFFKNNVNVLTENLKKLTKSFELKKINEELINFNANTISNFDKEIEEWNQKIEEMDKIVKQKEKKYNKLQLYEDEQFKYVEQIEVNFLELQEKYLSKRRAHVELNNKLQKEKDKFMRINQTLKDFDKQIMPISAWKNEVMKSLGLKMEDEKIFVVDRSDLLIIEISEQNGDLFWEMDDE